MIFLLPLFLSISSIDHLEIGKKIWKNECNQTIEGLVYWSEFEPFPSLGIGHFIWFPPKVDAPFEETFPGLLNFIEINWKLEGKELPKWLKPDRNLKCPWKNRQEFQNLFSEKQKELSSFLLETIELQARFIYERFEKGKDKLKNHLSKKAIHYLEALCQTTKGRYLLIDYTNFKGWGLDPKERYRNQGWGLYQVLEQMEANLPKEKLELAFANAAKEVLLHRIKASPKSKQEERWKKGWFNRIDTYH